MNESKDWTGNAQSVFVCNGASNHTTEQRQEDDYYATDPIAIHKLCEVENFSKTILEPACGGGHMVKALLEKGYEVIPMDIVDRGCENVIIQDFFSFTPQEDCQFDIITNPPYKFAKEFVEHAIEILPNNHKLAMFLKLTFLESKSRKEMFKKYPPKKIWVSSERIQCAKNGDFEKYSKGVGTAVAYAWYIWEKGYDGQTTVGWI